MNSYRAGFDMGDEWGLVGEAIGGVINYDRGIPKFRCAGACPWPDPVRARDLRSFRCCSELP